MPNGQNEVRDLIRQQQGIAALLPNDIVLEQQLAEGGQGVVYRGHAAGTPAAIKIYLPGQLQRRVQREVDALAALDCPSIVNLLWSGTVEIAGCELPVVATSLVPGDTLNEILSARALTETEIGAVAHDVVLAINAMWERRIVHRDLKPSNLMFKPDGRACVIDLGLARHVELSSLTGAGAAWGTLGYMSPEQTRGVRQLTCKSDLYALGVILLEAAIGRHPTNGDQLRLMTGNFHSQLPQELEDWSHADLVKALLHPRPTKRPAPSPTLGQLSSSAPPNTP